MNVRPLVGSLVPSRQVTIVIVALTVACASLVATPAVASRYVYEVERELGVDLDGDGIPDAHEDTDHDGLNNAFELSMSLTDPRRADSDSDGIRDSVEDDDGDGLSSLGEQRYGTDPHAADSDGDGRDDWHDDANHDGHADGPRQDAWAVPAHLRPSLARAYRDMSWIGRQPCHSRAGYTDPTTCTFIYGPRSKRKTVLLIGDSHAVHWFEPLRVIAAHKGWKLITMTKSNCPWADVTNYHRDRVSTDCGTWRRKAFARIRLLRPDMIVASSLDSYTFVSPTTGRPTEDAAAWKRGLVRSLKELRKGSRKVVVLGDVFHWGKTVIACLKAHTHDVSACERRQGWSRGAFGRKRDAIAAAAAASTGVMFRPTWQLSCSYDPCPLVVDGILVTRDGGHLTTVYARVLRRGLERLLPDP